MLSAYADDTTFFVSDLNSILEIIKLFDEFSKFSGLKLNRSKCEVCGIGVKKGEVTALCGFKNVDLTTDSVKILGVHFSYNKDICRQRNFLDVVKKIENVIKVWRLRCLTLLGKICIFKTLAISKIISISFLSSVPCDVISTLEMIHKNFIWDNKRAKIKHITLIGNYAEGGLKDIDIKTKIDALHLSWVNRLYDGNFHPWKLIPTFLFKKLSQCSSTIFYPNFDVNSSHFLSFPVFYKNIIAKWISFSRSEPITVSSILSESIWHNCNIRIGNCVIRPAFFNMNQPLFFSNLFDANGNFISWAHFRDKYSINNKLYFRWLQLKSCLPRSWVNTISTNLRNFYNLCNFEPHVNFNARIITLDKLKSRAIYDRLISKMFSPSTSQAYYNNIFDVSESWSKIYLTPRFSTIDTFSRVFQFKILHNILYLNDRLFRMGLVDSPLCSLCNSYPESIDHLFCSCPITKSLWIFLQLHLRNHVVLNNLTPQSALLGFFDDESDNFCLINHILLIFKIFLFKFRAKNPTPILLLSKLKQAIDLELCLCHSDRTKDRFNAKWKGILSVL